MSKTTHRRCHPTVCMCSSTTPVMRRLAATIRITFLAESRFSRITTTKHPTRHGLKFVARSMEAPSLRYMVHRSDRAEAEDFEVLRTFFQTLVRRPIEEYLLVDRIPHSLVELFHGTRVEDVVEAQLDLGPVG
jgi:hypothetical protein